MATAKAPVITGQGACFFAVAMTGDAASAPNIGSGTPMSHPHTRR